MRMSSWKHALASFAAVLFLWAVCLESQGRSQVLQAKEGAVRALELPGQVEAAEQTKLHTKIAGFVQKIHVDIGDRVKKGQVLAELSVPEIEAELRQKAALIAQAEAEVELARRGVQVAEAALVMAAAQTEEGEAGVKRARANLERWNTEFERLEKLWQNKVIDKQVLDEKRHQVEAARAGLAEAEAKGQAIKATRDGSMAKREMSKAELKVTEARLQVARADAQRVDTLLQYSKVSAPFDGVIARRNVETGAFARSGDGNNVEPLLVIHRIDSVRIAIDIPESAVSHVSKGMRAVIRFPAFKGMEVKAMVSRIGGALDRDRRTLRAEIDLPNSDGKLLPGMYAAVAIKGLETDEPKKDQSNAPANSAELKSGPQAGTNIPGPFHPIHVTGPFAGRKACLLEYFGARPVAMIFARELSEPLVSLLKKIDAANTRNSKIGSFAVFLTDDDQAEGKLAKLREKEGIKKCVLSLYDPSGPKAYRVSKEAAVTVVLYSRYKVDANFAFRQGELDALGIERVMTQLKAISAE